VNGQPDTPRAIEKKPCETQVPSIEDADGTGSGRRLPGYSSNGQTEPSLFVSSRPSTTLPRFAGFTRTLTTSPTRTASSVKPSGRKVAGGPTSITLSTELAP